MQLQYQHPPTQTKWFVPVGIFVAADLCLSFTLAVFYATWLSDDLAMQNAAATHQDYIYEGGETAAALRGAAEAAVAQRGEMGDGTCYPAPPVEDNFAVVPSISAGGPREDAAEAHLSSKSRHASSCSGESACPPPKRHHTALSS